MDEKQLSFPWAKQYKKTSWMFTCLCWSCLRFVELPAGVFLQGDPVCVCGGTFISANWTARQTMEELEGWKQERPIIINDRKILKWYKGQLLKRNNPPLIPRQLPAEMRAVVYPGTACAASGRTPESRAGRKESGSGILPPAFLAKIIERKAPRAVLCTLPRFASLGDSCFLSAASQSTRPQGRAALARAERNNTTRQAGAVPLLQSASTLLRTLASPTNADAAEPRNSPRAETLTNTAIRL